MLTAAPLGVLCCRMQWTRGCPVYTTTRVSHTFMPKALPLARVE